RIKVLLNVVYAIIFTERQLGQALGRRSESINLCVVVVHLERSPTEPVRREQTLQPLRCCGTDQMGWLLDPIAIARFAHVVVADRLTLDVLDLLANLSDFGIDLGGRCVTSQRQTLDSVLNVGEHWGRVAHDIGEVTVVLGDALVDLLLNRVSVEIVADADVFVRRTDAVNAPDPLLYTHEVPRHVVIDESPGRLQVQTFAHGVCTDEDFKLATAEPGLDLRLRNLGPASRLDVVDLPTSARVAAEAAVPRREKPLADVVHRVSVLGEDDDRGVRVQSPGHVCNKFARFAVFTRDAIEVLEERLELCDFVTEAVGSRVEGLW